MAQTYTINGVDYTFPDVDDSDWGQNVTDWAGAVSSFLLQRTGGTFTLSSAVDFGSTAGLKLKDIESKTTSPAAAGFMRLAKTDVIAWKNDGGTGDVTLAKKAGTDNFLQFNSIDLVNLSTAQTLTTKTLTSPVIDTGISGSAIDDNTSLTGSSATKVPTQNAVKTYVDAQVTASDLDFQGDSGGAQSVDLDSQSLTVEGGTGVDTTGSSQKISVAIDSSVTTNSGTQTLTNKTLTSPKLNEDVALSATSTYLNRMDATSSVQTQLDAKQATITGAATTITGADLTASKVLQSNGSGKVEASAVTTTTLGYLDASSSVQTQINSKQATITGAATTITGSDLTASKVVQSNGSGKIEASAVTTTTLGYLDASSSIQTQLDAKQATITGAATTITGSDLTASKVLQSNGSGKVEASSVTTTTLGYLDASSSVQTQLDAKAALSNPNFTGYADFNTISAPGAPGTSGQTRLYSTAGKLYFHGNGGSETEIGAGGGGAGDADTIQLKTAEASEGTGSAPWYTGNNPVPGGGGSIGGTWELSTSNPLINTNDATKVFHYSNATSDRKGDYFEIELDVPNYAKGHNLVVQLFYRTVGAEDTDFLFFARDRTGDYSTTTTSTGAQTTITLASATGFAVGDRICLQDSSEDRHFRYVTAVSGSDITFSGSAITFASGDAVVSKFFTDELDFITAENNTTNYEGKIRKWAFQINETTTKIRVGFLYDNSATSTNELFFDQILLSSNQFLQASSQGQTESYYAYDQNLFWNDTGDEYEWDEALLVGQGNTPPLAQSKLISIADDDSKTKITAKQNITLSASLNGVMNTSGWIAFYNSDNNIISYEQQTGAHVSTITIDITLAKNDYVYVRGYDLSNQYGNATIVATPQVNDVVLLNSQDELFTDWVDAGPIVINGSTSNPTKGGTTTDKMWWRRNGCDMEIRFEYVQSSGGLAGSGDYLFQIPAGYSIDLGKVTAYNTVEGGSAFWNTSNCVGMAGYAFPGGTSDGMGIARVYDSTSITISYIYLNSSTSQGVNTLCHTTINLADAVLTYWANFKVPIAGWTSTFNPVLSMPLVEIGGNMESGLWYGAQSNNAFNGNTYRPFYNNNSYNTVSNLGTVTNNNTVGWNFQANQRVKATINWTWSQTSSGSYSASIIKKDTLGSNVTDGSSDWTGYKICKSNTVGASSPAETSATVLMNAGEYLFPVTNSTDSDTATDRSVISIVVEKDFSNTNMAHIIKPAVCILKDVKTGFVSGGTSSTGSWETRTLNTVSGESWFVTLASNQFTLEAGMYKINASAPYYKTDAVQIGLYDITNSAFKTMGQSTSYQSTYSSAAAPTLKSIFTITSSTVFELRGQVENAKATNGFGIGNNYGEVNVFAEVMIEKLK